MAVLFQEEVHSHLSERQKQKQTLHRYWKNSRMITSERILKAFMEIPREYFVETSFADQAYADHPLPIGEGQTISQPTTVMLMLQLLEVEPEHRVLEIGAGCGYNAALLGLLAKEVVTIERHEKLAVLARANLEHSPYNRIIVTAAAQNIPVQLKEQIALDGILLSPVGQSHRCEMLRIHKTPSNQFQTSTHGLFSFVPLV